MSVATRVIDIFVFRGLGRNGSDEHALIQFGHAGVSVDKGITIYGFSPAYKAIEALDETDEGIGQFLKKGGILRGQVYDDTKIFKRAAVLNHLGKTNPAGALIEVWRLSYTVSEDVYQRIRDTLHNQFRSGSPYPSWYQLPTAGAEQAHLPRHNCITWLRTLNIDFGQTGQIREDIETLMSKGANPWHP